MDIHNIRNKVRKNEYDLSFHAHQERQDEQITIAEIEQVILKGDIIEKYSNDPRGESCLVGSRNLHIVCGTRGTRLLIITVYRPKPPTWVDYKTRVKEVKNRV
ncbi:hypothetical protein A3D00_01160 [Candidatus Woesebacteria bacterium RIFCSPHIGHO2_02_FULL_38_9]|uniref:DUF4258 domain-containing protein n=1 Tax=Candidatus Woesebacteria bacterium RIFCSPHIGHO2_01_FULL_39_28 TaxID=1802496 RepID=A0A1F7YJ44_9BACT|nr:MAG: hypothetical protein A2627_01235 [Candidatus Woesebacteria bacterium RIFCSPHIGHO2_01_FULL_39_28]OGM31732.1 MAG: hypothetical protein A3D00_01160 [Candidatus Woesebacteria bacterium RIFCSPHIGHO2_02_FULL_38_9]OGM57673.1 MAG: hypothetical protein A3A50_01535 [Candidatus Woesebacteria bacterium RIFCSPLOWO2_01_FULL_38_20]